ncbi:sex determination protein fruitless isoform X2 [Sabethes cyaneus]|uniref:sex determination protein fruitless isoform X2 n=1 Tax=Sabethes cyaneus TaxID=53552 RepID=UPI00237D398B|nr:sex determination protein fruitless isoform X2 [Sabethes cyaneus]
MRKKIISRNAIVQVSAEYYKISKTYTKNMDAKAATTAPQSYPATPPYAKGARSSHQYFSLRWNNYQSNMTSVFHELLETQSFVDVTLACEYNSLKAHKVVLSACSAYFQKILLDNPCKHPTIILPSDICFSDLQFIIEFVYRGEIDVSEAELQSLLRTAEQLKIKGLCEVNEPQYEQDFSPSIKRYKPYRSRSPDNRHPPPPGSLSTTTARSSQSSSQNNNNQSGQDSKSGHKSSSGRSHSSNSESVPIDNGSSPVVVLESRDLSSTTGKEGKSKMTSLGMGVGINGSVMGVSMGYLDFAPEPPAPTATPVTEHVDINCAPSHDTRDLSSKYSISNNGDIRVKFETLRSLDPQDAIQLDNQVAHQMHSQSQQQQLQHQQMLHQQQQQQHLIQQQHQQQHQQQQAHRQTPQPQQVDQRLSPHQPSPQQQPQHQQHVLLIDQQSQHSHLSTHSPASNASSSSSQHHPENLVTVASTTVDNGTPMEMKTRITLKQEIISETEHQQQQHQQQMEVEQDQSSMHGMVVTPEISGMMSQSQMSDIYQSDASEDSKVGILDGSTMQYTNLTSPNASDPKTPSGPKTWTAEDMESALDALRTHNMSLTKSKKTKLKASATYGIPSTTLWQRAHRLGIDTPKKEGPSKTWNEDSLNSALEALRTGTISANKASKAFGIPSSTLYKIARREGIRLAAPFNAAPTTWSAEDLDRALEAIRAGQTSVQKASTEFGIPTGTLYGRCKREGIELSRSNPTPWSEDAMMEALESVKQGHMSINQAAIHYNLPYSSLYGRFKRGKYDTPNNTNSSHSNHGGGGAGGGGNVGGIGGIGSNVVTSAATMAGVTSSPQMEFKIEPQHSEHSPENTQHYNPALTTSLTTSSAPPSTQTHHVVPSQSPVNIHIINANHHHHQLQPTPPPPHQTVATTHHTLQGAQPQLIQHHIIPQQHHIIYQQPLQQLQQQPQYHPMYHIIKQENDRS